MFFNLNIFPILTIFELNIFQNLNKIQIWKSEQFSKLDFLLNLFNFQILTICKIVKLFSKIKNEINKKENNRKNREEEKKQKKSSQMGRPISRILQAMGVIYSLDPLKVSPT